jgi:hypothetical protein
MEVTMTRDQHPGPAAPLRRGRLNNGNPPGDFLAAPRCGACARSGGSCRQPAMRNGRCWFHGGKSSGARTPEGLERIRRARLRHGARTAEAIALTAAAAASGRRLARLIAALRALSSGEGPAGHGVFRSNRGSSPGEAAVPSQVARLALPSRPTDGES